METMTINNEEWVKVSDIPKTEIVNMDANSPYEIGENYIVRTVTHITVGTLLSVGDKELMFSNASWVADTGRFHNMLKDGFSSNAEIEPYINNVGVGRGSIVDFTKYNNPLPEDQV